VAIPDEPLFRDGVPTETGDPLAVFRGTAGPGASLPGSGTSVEQPASQAADRASDAAAEGTADEVEASLVARPTRAIGIVVLFAAALMATAAGWWLRPTDA
jgi:hypothetical protein